MASKIGSGTGYVSLLYHLEELRDADLRHADDMRVADRRYNDLVAETARQAILKAETATERRFEGVNEFRQTLSDQASRFITRGEFEAQNQLSQSNTDRLNRTEGRGAGLGQGWGYLIGATGAIAAIAAIVIAWPK